MTEANPMATPPLEYRIARPAAGYIEIKALHQKEPHHTQQKKDNQR